MDFGEFFLRNLTFPQINFKNALSSSPKPPPVESSFIINNDGDTGTSKVLSGLRLAKNHPLMHAIGETEELNAHIGAARVYAREANHPYVEHLKRIQTILIDLTSVISMSGNLSEGATVATELGAHTKEMEEWIEHYVNQIPKQVDAVDAAFIVPGGSQASAALQISRAICRRVERTTVGLLDENMIHTDVLAYLNRLGDFLLILSRIATKLDERTELVYIPKPNKQEDEKK